MFVGDPGALGMTNQIKNFGAKRIVSLQPSATVTIDRLGLLDRVVACTKYCVDVCPALAANPKLLVHDSWSANVAEIVAAKPDLVIASVPYQMESLAEILKAGVPVLALAPKTLADVYADIAHIANILNVPERGSALIAEMQSAIEAVRIKTEELLQSNTRPLVYCEEWGKPLIHSQPWVAELVEIAGGRFLREAGKTTSAEAVLAADPEVVLAAWCGAGDRVPLEKIIASRGWEKMRAAQQGRVYCINDEFLNTPGPTLVQGLGAIASALWPEDFPAAFGVRRIQSGGLKPA
jgi:iron complex transport system substrate-binding protein